jgi:hypothetical protein
MPPQPGGVVVQRGPAVAGERDDGLGSIAAGLFRPQGRTQRSGHARGPGRRAKKVNGRKRHIAAGTTGLVLDVVITATFARREGRPPGA